MKFVMTQSICPEGIEKLKADTNGQVEIIAEDNPDPNNYLDDMKDADALIVRIAKCDAHAIENSPNLKVIGRTGVGYDSVDVKKATELGIPVVITPGANNRSVAEHAVAMMFALSKNLYEGQVETRKGNWEIRGAHKAFELEGKTVGVIGLGAIGRETAKAIVARFGDKTMDVLEKQPDITCLEIIETLDLPVSIDTVWRFLQKAGYRRKKKSLHASEQEHPQCGAEEKRLERPYIWIQGK